MAKKPPSIYDVGMTNPIRVQIVQAQAKQTAAKIQKEIKALQKLVGKNNTAGKPPKVVPSKGDQTPPPVQPDANYKWNLPPHKWSLPIKPEKLNMPITSSDGFTYTTANPLKDIEKYRRGRIWWYASNQMDFYDAKGKVKKKELNARKFGFQFLWNPDSYNVGVQLNMDATPTALDPFKGLAGAYPGMESMSFTLRLDRTNDFAAMRALLNRNYSNLEAEGTAGGVTTSTNPAVFKQMAEYYKTNFESKIVDESVKYQQIKELMELGTLADLEYLYKAVNGDGWFNIAGRKTSDIGFLGATLVRIDIGPAAYIGYINSLGVNHIAFSQDMTPIRTDVTVSINLMTTAVSNQSASGVNNNASGNQ